MSIFPIHKDTTAQVRHWFASRYSEFPHLSFGQRGSELLFDVFSQESRTQVVLPAFICTEISAMAVAAGKQIVHIDVDRRTMHFNIEMLEQWLTTHDPANVILLIDHTFGYPVDAVLRLRNRYPSLFIVEDGVRALGAKIQGCDVGQTGDCALFSMYKTTPGNTHGAILLTRRPYAIRQGPPPPIALRHLFTNITPARKLHDAIRTLTPDRSVALRNVSDPPEWKQRGGSPNALAIRRFAAHLQKQERYQRDLIPIAAMIQNSLAAFLELCFIEIPTGSATAGDYLSLTVAEGIQRDRFLIRLHRAGVFLSRTWHRVPAFFRCFQDTFPFGAAGSIFLADHIVHIPLRRFQKPSQRRRLQCEIGRALADSAVHVNLPVGTSSDS